MSTHRTLRAANAARQAEWDPGKVISLSYRGNELGGECGEAQNVIKKLERERLGIRGSRATIDDLAQELADVVICADLIAMAEGIDLDQAVAAKFNATSQNVGLATRLQAGPTWPRHRMRIDLRGVCSTTVDYLKAVEHPLRGKPTAEDRDGQAAFLEQLSQHITDVREGRASLADFADFYCITPEVGLIDKPASPPDEDDETCLACREGFDDHDQVFLDVSGDYLHARCCGPERESYVNEDGEPLGPDDPIPTGFRWGDRK